MGKFIRKCLKSGLDQIGSSMHDIGLGFTMPDVKSQYELSDESSKVKIRNVNAALRRNMRMVARDSKTAFERITSESSRA